MKSIGKPNRDFTRCECDEGKCMQETYFIRIKTDHNDQFLFQTGETIGKCVARRKEFHDILDENNRFI